MRVYKNICNLKFAFLAKGAKVARGTGPGNSIPPSLVKHYIHPTAARARTGLWQRGRGGRGGERTHAWRAAATSANRQVGRSVGAAVGGSASTIPVAPASVQESLGFPGAGRGARQETELGFPGQRRVTWREKPCDRPGGHT